MVSLQRTVQTYDAAAANASAFYKRNMEQVSYLLHLE